MKHTILLLLLLVSVRASAKFSQVIYVKSTGQDVKKVHGFYEFENDEVKITYSFWGENGLMGFQIYNKTSHPIYIDWKKSAMIYNSHQNPYYTNKTTSNYVGYGSSYGSGWASIFGRSILSSHSGSNIVSSTETVVKQERTTFIPPHSYISNAFYNLLAHIDNFSVNKRESKKEELYGKLVYVQQPGDPIIFRNFITYSATEDFAVEKYADNEFSIFKVATMHNDDFTDEWVSASRFYISNIKRGDLFE